MHFRSIKYTFLSLCVNLESTAKVNICCYTPTEFIVQTGKDTHGKMSWEVPVKIFKILGSEKIRKNIFECNWFPKTSMLLFLLNSIIKPTLITPGARSACTSEGSYASSLLWSAHCFEQKTPWNVFQYKSKRKGAFKSLPNSNGEHAEKMLSL